MSKTQWNGEPCAALRVTATVADSGIFPQYWAREFVGTRRKAVRVEYGGNTFYLDDEDGSGWNKVTHGGSPNWGHRDLIVDPGSVEPRAVAERLTVDTITSDQLDALQLQAARMEHAVKHAAELAVRLEDAEAGITAAIRQRKEQEDRALRAEAAIARVRERCQGVRDRSGPGGMINATQILGLLSPIWPDGNYEAAPAAPDEQYRFATEWSEYHAGRAALDEPKEQRPAKPCCGRDIGHTPGCRVNQGLTDKDAASRCTCAGVGFSDGTCKVHHPSVPAHHRIRALPVDPEMERAATERARQCAADSEHAAERLAKLSGQAGRCGCLSPETLLTTPPVPCVLPPGHEDHTDDHGLRWRTVPPAAPVPEATEATDTTKEN